MRLISLELRNFRQHLDSSITFSDGVTGVIGSNGAGKTTILEAISWALYGAPAVRGTNDTIRSRMSEGGAKVSVALSFELGGSVYRVSRTLDAAGRSGSAVLEVDGRALRTGMSEVTAGIARVLGMDYQAFFTSFFTGQKQLEFMSQLEGRDRAVAISRMLGYDRLTKARDRANEDRKGLAREIEGLERGLADPEDIKLRKADAESALSQARTALEGAEKSHTASSEALDRLKPAKETSDQKAKRYDEVSRRLQLDRAEEANLAKRGGELRAQLAGLAGKRKELGSLADDLRRFDEAGREYRVLADLQKHEGERQRLSGQISALEQDIKRLSVRANGLPSAQQEQTRASAAVLAAEELLRETERRIQAIREERVARLHGLEAQVKQLEPRRTHVQAKRAQIEQAGEVGECPTCERPLAEELETVLASFDAQVVEIDGEIARLTSERVALESDTSALGEQEAVRGRVAREVEDLRSDKAKADARVAELGSIVSEAGAKNEELGRLAGELDKLPGGFDQDRYQELRRVGEELRPVYKRSIELKSALDQEPGVTEQLNETDRRLELVRAEVAAADQALGELAFSSEDHDKLLAEFDAANAALNGASIVLERQRGEFRTADAVLKQIEAEENAYRGKIDELKQKRSERLYLQTLAEAFDRLRAELNDRIRPELEAVASELLAVMTDGRYNVLEVSDNYQATIRDDGELKPVISGGEDDLVNLALRLAVSQMIAERAGQSFSLLILDEVFGSLDDTRRDNVVALLQNLKNRFQQIILITHVESIHDAVDNCLWVEFDEKTKTSRLSDRSSKVERVEVGVLA